jgi:lipopolysaccharide export system permease protein
VLIFRYLAREVYASLSAVTLVMVFVFLANQAIRWLSDAAAGNLATNTLLQLLALQLPYLLGLLLPLGLYLGVLITYSRLYAENEMTVLFSSGMSRLQLTKITLIIATLIFALVSVLMLLVNPVIASEKNTLLESTSTSAFISSIVPGSFQETPSHDGVIYVKNLSHDKEEAQHIFIAQSSKDEKHPNSWMILSAKEGGQTDADNDDDSFVVAKEGYRYQGTPGENDFQVIKFDHYGLKVDDLVGVNVHKDTNAIPTLALIKNSENDPSYVSELQWRFSLPLSVYVLAILGVAICKVQPRQGRFQQLVPAIILYVIYANLLFIARDWVENNVVSPVVGVWWVHLLFFSLAMLIFLFQSSVFQRGRYGLPKVRK